MIEAGQRAIVDHESEAAARRQAESNGDRGTNRSAMCNGDNVPALVGLVHARDRGADPYNEIGEAFAVWRAFVRSRIPEGVRLLLAVHQKLVAIESLPISEMLLGEVFVLLKFLLGDHPLVGEARGLGLIGGLELVADKTSKRSFAPQHGVGASAVRFAEAEGLIVRSVLGDVLTLSPPLVISATEIEELFDRLTRALDKTLDWVMREGLTQA
jgi:hypothetical protein